MPGRRLVVEADGGSRGNPGPAAFGALVRDPDTGEVLAEHADVLGVATNNVAEYEGLLAGLRLAREIDPEAVVEVRLDSKLIVEQMSGGWRIKNPALQLLARAARDVLPFDRVSYAWVPRERNRAADALVNSALDAEQRGERARVDRVLSDDAAGRPAASSAAVGAGGSQDRPRNAVIGWAPDLGLPTTTVLLRHGATEFSLGKRFSGAGGRDVPLAPVGVRQVEAAAAEIVARGGVDVVIASPLQRARQTAEHVVAAHAALGRDVELEVLDGFAECGFGEWDGRTFAEVAERWPVELEAWLASPDVAPPGGESFAQHRARVDAARLEVLTRYPGQVAAVATHVTPVKTMVGLALDAPVHSVYRMELGPGSITTIAWWADGNASVRGFADVSHLRSLANGEGV